MKNLVYTFAVLVLTLSACEYDNFDPPTSELKGRFVYEGTQVAVRHKIDVVNLYQHGWDNFDPINVNVAQDGTFTSILFDGDYKLVLTSGNGPWLNQLDSLDVKVRGATTFDVPVEPFFLIRDENIQLNGNTLTASFKLDHIVEDSELEYVSLFIGKTRFLDNHFKIGEERRPAEEVGDLGGPVLLSMDLSEVKEDFVFARIGVKTKESAELLFSQVQQLEFQ